VIMWRRRPLIIGVTGSVGKTTTKEVIAAMLEHPFAKTIVGRVWKSAENMNDNELFPLAILCYGHEPRSRAQDIRWCLKAPFRAIAYATFLRYPDTLVLEYAASIGGDVARTAALAPPRIGIITAIGPAHLERFGTIARVMDEKGALIRNLPPDGLAILGADNEYTATMDNYTGAPVVKVPGRGRKLSENIARVIGRYLRIPDAVTEAALAQIPPVPGRLYVQNLGPLLLIDDAFNANPLSMTLGLDSLAELAPPGWRKIAVMGEMKELCTEAARYHQEMAPIARARADVVIGIGALAKNYSPDHWFADSVQCANALPGILKPRDCILVKGSHSVKLFHAMRCVKHLAREWQASARAGATAETSS